MFKKIMVPVDLGHLRMLDKALQTAADLARYYGAAICYVGVTGAEPSAVAHTPAEFASRLQQFGSEQASAHTLPAVTTQSYTSHDPAAELDRTLLKAIADTGADLVVMASHKPGLPDYLFGSNAGWLAAHAPISVVVVR